MTNRGNLFANIENEYREMSLEDLKTDARENLEKLILGAQAQGQNLQAAVMMSLSCADIGLENKSELTEPEKSLISAVFHPLLNMTDDELYDILCRPSDPQLDVILPAVSKLGNTVAIPVLHLVLCFAYADGEISDELAQKLENYLGVNLIAEFFQSGAESVPSQTVSNTLSELEAQIVLWFKETGTLHGPDETQAHFSASSSKDVQRALEHLRELDILFGGPDLFGNLYGLADENIQAEPRKKKNRATSSSETSSGNKTATEYPTSKNNDSGLDDVYAALANSIAPMTCAQIAEEVGLTLHATTVCLTRLRKEGKIRRDYEGKTPVYSVGVDDDYYSESISEPKTKADQPALVDSRSSTSQPAKSKPEKKEPGSELIFTDANRLDIGRYSLIIPEGFSVKRNVEGRSFWAWLPDAADPGDRINAPILLLEGQFLPDPDGGFTPVQEWIKNGINGMRIMTRITGLDIAEPEEFHYGDVHGFVASMGDDSFIGTVKLPEGGQQIRVTANLKRYQGEYAKNLLLEVLKTVRIKGRQSERTGVRQQPYDSGAGSAVQSRVTREELERQAQKESTLSFLKRNPEASCADVAEHLGVTLHSANGILYQLRKEGLVARRYRDKTPVYSNINYSEIELREIKTRIITMLDLEDHECSGKEISDRLGVPEVVTGGLIRDLDANNRIIVVDRNSCSPRYTTTASLERVKKKKEQEEEARKNRLYEEALAHAANNNSIEIQTAISMFETLTGYKDVSERIEMCRKKLNSVLKEEKRLAEEEAARVAREKAIAEEKRRKRKRTALIIGICLAAVLAGVLIFLYAVRPEMIYRDALAEMESGRYDAATGQFKRLDGYKDSEDKITEIENVLTYQDAEKALQSKDYDTAETIFRELGYFSDSAARVEEVIEARNSDLYSQAEAKLKENDLDGAQAIFAGLGDYSDSEQRVAEIIEIRNHYTYEEAEKALKIEDFDKAEELFTGLGDYSDASDRVQDVIDARIIKTYEQAAYQFENGNYEKAKELYDSLGSYSDAEDRADQAQQKINEKIYAEAEQYYASGNYKDAKENYEKLGDYLDAKQKAETASNELKKQEEIAALRKAWDGMVLFNSRQGGYFVFEFEWGQGAGAPVVYFSDAAGKHWCSITEITEKKVVLYDGRGVTHTLTKNASGNYKWFWESTNGMSFS